MALSFGFTARDRDLAGGRRYVDPLGVGPIWTNLARRLVPHLTQQSSQAEGFELLICGVWLFEQFRASAENDDALSFEQFYVLLEQAVAHKRYAHDGKWDLPGRRAVVATSTQGRARMGLEHQILDAQFIGGTWGLYSAAAERALLCVSGAPALSDGVRQAVGDGMPSAQQQRAIFRAITRAAKSSYDLSRADWTEPLVDLLRRIHHRDILRDRIIKAPVYSTPEGFPRAKPSLLRQVALLAPRKRPSAASSSTDDADAAGTDDFWRQFVAEGAARDWDVEEVGDAARIFTEILAGESYMAPLQELFDALFRFHGEPVSKAASELNIPLGEWADAQMRFGELRFWNEAARQRAPLLARVTLDSPERAITKLIEIHGEVARWRGRASWLVVEAGRILVLVDQEPLVNPELSPSRAWRATYYLPALRSVARGLRVR